MSEKKRKSRYNDLEGGPAQGREYSESLDARVPVKLSGKFYDVDFEVIKNLGLFTESQKADLLQNGLPENAGMNHKPVAYIEVKRLGYSILATEINSENQDLIFGLCDYDGEVKFSTFSIAKLNLDLKNENPVFSTNLDFVGKYPIAVYAKVAEEVGTIVTNDKDRRLKPLFDNFSSDIWSKQAAKIKDLKPLE